jgi:hypothetical protein
LIVVNLIILSINIHGDSTIVSRAAKRTTLIALLALLLSLPVTLCRGETAAENRSNEYDRILQLVSNEDWKTASEAAASYLAKVDTSGDEHLQARLRYIIIYTTAGAVSTGACEFDVLDQRLKGFVGKSVTLPYRPVVNNTGPGGMNAICISDPHATSFMVVAANESSTTIHAFEYVKLQQAVDFAAHAGEWGSITGTLRKIEPNPNKSRAIVLRIYIDDATVAFSKHKHETSNIGHPTSNSPAQTSDI